MPSCNVEMERIQIIEGTAPVLKARILDDNEEPVLSSAVQSITCSVYAVLSPGRGVLTSGPTTLVVADSWFDTMQPWLLDNEGWNFRAKPPAAAFITPADCGGTNLFQIEIRATPFSGEPFWLIFLQAETVDAFSL